MSRFGLHKNRALISGVLSACCCSFVQQYVKANDKQDAEDLLKYVNDSLFLFNMAYKEKNSYSLIGTANRAFGEDRGTSFENRAKMCHNYIYSYDEGKKSDITCWTSSLALIHFINLWYEESYAKFDPKYKPRFYLGLFSYHIRFTNGLVNHCGVCVILGRYCLLFDPIVGKSSSIIDLEDNRFSILAISENFFNTGIITKVDSGKEKSGRAIDKFKSKLTDYFAGVLAVPAEEREILLSENYVTSKHKPLGDVSFAEFREFLWNYTGSTDEELSKMFTKDASFAFQFV